MASVPAKTAHKNRRAHASFILKKMPLRHVYSVGIRFLMASTELFRFAHTFLSASGVDALFHGIRGLIHLEAQSLELLFLTCKTSNVAPSLPQLP